MKGPWLACEELLRWLVGMESWIQQSEEWVSWEEMEKVDVDHYYDKFVCEEKEWNGLYMKY